MECIGSLLGRRYAQAFFTLFLQNQSTNDHIENIRKLSCYLKARGKTLSLFSLSVIEDKQKIRILEELTERFELKEILHPLVLLLARTKRLELISIILTEIDRVYARKNNLMQLAVSSSTELKAEQKHALIAYLEKQTGLTLHATFIHDAQLIAGIRAVGDTFLWEDSLAKNIKQIATLIRKG